MSFLNDIPLNDLRYLILVLFIIGGSASIYYRKYIKAILDKYFKKEKNNDIFSDICSKCGLRNLVDEKLEEIRNIIADTSPELKLNIKKISSSLHSLRIKEIRLIEKELGDLSRFIESHDNKFKERNDIIIEKLKEIINEFQKSMNEYKNDTEELDDSIDEIKNIINVIKDELIDIKKSLKEGNIMIHSIDTSQILGKENLERILNKVEKTSDAIIEISTKLELITKKDVAF